MDNYLLLVDTYENETINEAALKSNGVVGMIIRLNHIQGGHHLDENFKNQWKEAGEAGLLRVPYFVYNPWVDGEANYNWFVRYVPYEVGAIMIDVEVEFPNYPPNRYATELEKFCQLVAPRWNYMIYTGQGYLNLLSKWPTEADYWWAQYPAVLYPEHPEQWTWDKVREKVDALSGPLNVEMVPGRFKMWQCTGDRLILPGSAKPIDVNIYPGTLEELKNWINEKPPVDDDFLEEHSTPFDGVEFHKVRRFNSHCHVAVIDPKGKQFLVTKFGLKTVSTVARQMGAQLVTNGGAYRGSRAIGLHASRGRIYRNVLDYEPWLNLNQDNKPEIHPYNSRARKYNALAGKRIIVEGGQICRRTSAAWREVHPRTLAGVSANGKLILAVIDGRQGPNNIGVDLYDGALIMIEFGAQSAIDLDGGGSSAMWLKDKIVNTPIEDGIPGQERLVGTHVVMFVDGFTPPPAPGGNYEVVIPVKPRKTPSMYQVDAKSNLPIGTTFNSETTQVVTERIPPLVGTDYTITWVQMPDGYWVPKFYKKEYVVERSG